MLPQPSSAMGSFANPSSSPAWDIQPDRRLIGVCYYPELFLLSEVEPDLRRIRDIGFNAIRIAEGAWAHFEPAEGQYRFDLFDTVLDLAHRLGLSVVFGTPTYCGPAWIARRYPETLRHDFHRRPLAHGSRRCYTYNSPTYQRLCDQITGTLADRYAKHPAIVAWQIDNEFNCHSSTSYAPDDTRQFRRFLRERYGEIDRLNDAWGTRFWSQCYDSFEQVDLPAPTPAPPNPHQLLDEQRFINDSCAARCG